MNQPQLRSHAMTNHAAQAAVDQACRALRLPAIRTRVEETTTRGRPRAAVLLGVSG